MLQDRINALLRHIPVVGPKDDDPLFLLRARRHLVATGQRESATPHLLSHDRDGDSRPYR
jgi:hypothetical protein